MSSTETTGPAIRCESCNDPIPAEYRVRTPLGWRCAACLTGQPPELALTCSGCFADADDPSEFSACVETCWLGRTNG